MRLTQYLNERIIDTERLEKIKKVFSKIPASTPEAISDYVVNGLQVLGVKVKSGGYTYLSGPMTNLPDDNWPVFIYAEKYLPGKFVNPAKPHGKILKKPTANFNWHDYMIEDVYDLVKCKKIIVMPGYSKSTGAKVEILIGKKLLNVKPVEFKKIIGEKNFKLFLEDVKNQYLKDGFEKEYYSIIEPMLTSKSEKVSASFVKTFIPENTQEYINENILTSIKDFMKYIKDGSLKSILKLIGLILSKSNIKKIKR